MRMLNLCGAADSVKSAARVADSTGKVAEDTSLKSAADLLAAQLKVQLIPSWVC